MTVHELISQVSYATNVSLYQSGLLLCKETKCNGIDSFYNDWKVDLIWVRRNRIEASISPPHLWRKEQDDETSRSYFTH